MSASESGQVSMKGGHVQQALRWIECGWRLLQPSLPLWIGMSFLYLVLAALLEAVPFAGHLLLVLVSPMLLTGALHALPAAPAANHRGSPTRFVAVSARQLVQAFAAETRAYPAVLLGILVVGFVVAVAIVQYLIGAGSVTAEWAAARRGAAHTISAVLRLAASGVLYALLIMALFYAAHRVVYGHREPMTAIADSFAAARRHAGALAALVLVFVVPYIIVAGAFQAAPWLGYIALFSIGLVALPLLVLASYCSYREVFGER